MSTRFKVIVEFTVEAEPLGPWTAEQCAADFVAHRIDEGYRLEEHIIDWDITDIAGAVS
jgi:hypothetical protein